jgi:hypothetical protein
VANINGVMLSTNGNGTMLGANGNGAMLYAMSAPRLHRCKDLSSNFSSAKPCNLGANSNGAKLRVYFLKAFRQGHI